MREVDLVDLIAGFTQDGILLQVDCREMRKQAIELIARKRGKQLVVQGVTGV
jgi:hypothetical protein